MLLRSSTAVTCGCYGSGSFFDHFELPVCAHRERTRIFRVVISANLHQCQEPSPLLGMSIKHLPSRPASHNGVPWQDENLLTLLSPKMVTEAKEIPANLRHPTKRAMCRILSSFTPATHLGFWGFRVFVGNFPGVPALDPCQQYHGHTSTTWMRASGR